MPNDLQSRIFGFGQALREKMQGIQNQRVAQDRYTRTPIVYYDSDPNSDVAGTTYGTGLEGFSTPYHVRIQRNNAYTPERNALAHELTHVYSQQQAKLPEEKIVAGIPASREKRLMSDYVNFYPQNEIPGEMLARIVSGQAPFQAEAATLRPQMMNSLTPQQQMMLTKLSRISNK